MLPVLRTCALRAPSRLARLHAPLNERKVPTPRGSRWHVSSITNLLARAQKIEEFR